MGGLKLDPRSVPCHFLAYTSGTGNSKVQDVETWCVFISHDVIFEEGLPHRTLMSVGEETPLFNSIIPPTNVSLGPINDTNSTINTDPVNQPHLLGQLRTAGPS